MFEKVREDLRRYGDTPVQQLRASMSCPGLWAILSYRFGNWVYKGQFAPPVKIPLKAAALAVRIGAEWATKMQIPETAEIGAGLYIAHQGYVIVGSNTVIGKHCTLTQGVTLGHVDGRVPTLGDRVYVGPGAAVVGGVTIGDDSLVGVGSVVRESLEPRSVTAGNPARVVARSGSFALNPYPDMDADPDRVASLAQVPARRGGLPPR